MMFFKTPIALILAVAGLTFANYLDSCTLLTFDGAVISADCQMQNGDMLKTYYNPNDCVANYDGNLACAANGLFSVECPGVGCQITHDGWLKCECEDRWHNTHHPQLWTGDCLDNDDGFIYCNRG